MTNEIDALCERLVISTAQRLMGGKQCFANVEDCTNAATALRQLQAERDALKAAGDRLVGFMDHYNECDWADRERCECGLTEAEKLWKELSDD